MENKNIRFVLVHGAYHGAWCWERIAGLLAKSNVEVFTPTLSGLGEKSNLLSASVNLSTHIKDVVDFLKENNLFNVVLVGHSYSGFVISGVAESVPERIGCLIYLDAMVPTDGQKVFDVRPSIKEKGQFFTVSGEKVKVLIPPEPQILGIVSPEDIAWVKKLLTPMPYACYDEHIKLVNPNVKSIKKVYLLNEIQTPGESQNSHEQPYRNALGDNWSRQVIPGPHDSMITHPKELAQILLGFAV